jgi:hypothetical protein
MRTTATIQQPKSHPIFPPRDISCPSLALARSSSGHNLTAPDKELSLESLESHLRALIHSFGKESHWQCPLWAANAISTPPSSLIKKPSCVRQLGLHFARTLRLGPTHLAMDKVTQAVEYCERSPQTHQYFAEPLRRDWRNSTVTFTTNWEGRC